MNFLVGLRKQADTSLHGTGHSEFGTAMLDFCKGNEAKFLQKTENQKERNFEKKLIS